MGIPICANCPEALEPHAGIVECFETIGEMYCAECWEEMCEANRAYDAEDSA